MNKSVKEKLESTFKDIQVSILEDSRIAVTVENHGVLVILRFLKDKGFDHLALLSAVDWIEEKEFELCFILTCYMQNDDEYTDSIFPIAEPYEREIHELFGIKFEGHKRLTPLLLEREYEIPPFRKDFNTREYVKTIFGDKDTS